MTIALKEASDQERILFNLQHVKIFISVNNLPQCLVMRQVTRLRKRVIPFLFFFVCLSIYLSLSLCQHTNGSNYHYQHFNFALLSPDLLRLVSPLRYRPLLQHLRLGITRDTRAELQHGRIPVVDIGSLKQGIALLAR